MTPLFVDTQSSQSTDSPPEGDTILSSQLRATQDVQQFTATQDPGNLAHSLTGGTLVIIYNV